MEELHIKDTKLLLHLDSPAMSHSKPSNLLIYLNVRVSVYAVFVSFLQNELNINYIQSYNMLLKYNCFIFLQNSNAISCNNCISCCDKAKLRSAKTIRYRDKLIVTVLHDIKNRTRVYSAQCACLLVDINKKINKIRFF